MKQSVVFVIRYFTDLILAAPEKTEPLKEMIFNNARAICEKGMSSVGLIGPSLDKEPVGIIDLAQHLSGVMILEMANRIQNT